MPVITLFSGEYCNEEAVTREVKDRTGYRWIDENEIIGRAAQLSGMTASKIRSAFSSKTSLFNRFTHEKERAVAHLRMSLAEILDDDNLLISGFSGLLIPRSINHVLPVCLIADIRSRISNIREQRTVSEKEALNLIRKSDEDCAAWVKMLFEKDDPWNSTLYDILVPTDKTSAADAAGLIVENVESDVLKRSERSRKAVADFHLAASAEAALTRKGHDVGVRAKDGVVTLIINKHVLMLHRLEEELRGIVEKIPGVLTVETETGKDFYQTDVYRRFDFETPSKVLLVDDEREFVQTLSERLMMRDMGSAVAYDGESALDIVNEDEPEVMILDLKMPGIDGIEVLRRVKQTRPEIEVIILTGHGSETDKQICMELGAFAYFQKPVDIDTLSEALRAANAKMRERTQSH
jgi:two-component system response regulator CpxR